MKKRWMSGTLALLLAGTTVASMMPAVSVKAEGNTAFLYTVLCISVCNGIFGGDCDQQQDPGRGAGYRGEVQTVLKRRLLDGSD